MAKAETLDKFLKEELPHLPRRMTRKQASDFITAKLFKIGEYTLRRWPLETRQINGRATVDTRETLIAAWKVYAGNDRARWPHYRDRLVTNNALEPVS